MQNATHVAREATHLSQTSGLLAVRLSGLAVSSERVLFFDHKALMNWTLTILGVGRSSSRTHEIQEFNEGEASMALIQLRQPQQGLSLST